MSSVQFRQADGTDAETLWWIKHAAIDTIETDAYSDEQLRAWKPDGEAVPDFERAIESGTFDVLVAERCDDVAGYGVLNADSGRIDALYVHPDHAGNGIATSLVGQLEMRARMYDITELELVSSLNAKSFYEELGYWDFGEEIRSMDGTEIPFVLMRKRV